MENSATGAKTAEVQRDVHTGNKRANALNVEAAAFALMANSDIGANNVMVTSKSSAVEIY
jgi:hypothetical protein